MKTETVSVMELQLHNRTDEASAVARRGEGAGEPIPFVADADGGFALKLALRKPSLSLLARRAGFHPCPSVRRQEAQRAHHQS